MGRSARRHETRRPLENGTLLPDFLGRGNLLARARRLEQQAENVATSMLSLGVADTAYSRRRGAIFMGGWGQASVSSGQSDVTLERYGQSFAGQLILPFGGSVTAILVALSTARTAGTLTIKVFVDGVDTGCQAVIDASNTLYVEEVLQVGECTFDAGQKVTLRISTNSWSPTSANVTVAIEVSAE